MMLPTLAVVDEVVEGRWCFGCGRRLVPKRALQANGRLRAGVIVRWREDICDNGPTGSCLLALAIVDPNNRAVAQAMKGTTKRKQSARKTAALPAGIDGAKP